MDIDSKTKVFKSKKRSSDAFRKTITDILNNSDDDASPSSFHSGQSNYSSYDGKKAGQSYAKAKTGENEQEKLKTIKLKLKPMKIPVLYSLSELSQIKRNFKTDDSSILLPSMKLEDKNLVQALSPVKKNFKAGGKRISQKIKREKVIKSEKEYLEDPTVSDVSEGSHSGISQTTTPKISQTKDSGAQKLVIDDILLKVAELEKELKEKKQPELELTKSMNRDLEIKCKRLEEEVKMLSKSIQEQKGDFNKGMGIQVQLSIAEKKKMAQMEKKLFEKENEMVILANTLKERESKIKIMETSNKEKFDKWIKKEKSLDLDKKLGEKDQQIEELQEKYQKMENVLKEKESEIRRFEEISKERNNKWITKEKALDIQRKLSEEIAEFQGKYMNVEIMLKDKEIEIEELQKSREDAINSMDNQMDEFKTLQKLVKDKESEIKKINKTNQELKVWKKDQLKKEKSILRDLESSRINSNANDDIIAELKRQLEDCSMSNQNLNQLKDHLTKKIDILELNCNEFAKKMEQHENRENSMEEELSVKNKEITFLNHKIEKQSEIEQNFYLELEQLNEEKDLALDKNKQKEIFNKKLDLIERHCLKRIDEKNDLIEKQKETIIDLNNRISEQSKNEQNLMMEMTQIMTEATKESNKKDEELDIKDRATQTKLEQTKSLEKCLTAAHEQIRIKEKDLEDKMKDNHIHLKNIENLEGLVNESSEKLVKKDRELENLKSDINMLNISIEKLEVLVSSLENDISRLNKSNLTDNFETKMNDSQSSQNLNGKIFNNWPIVEHKSNQNKKDVDNVETFSLSVNLDLLLRWLNEHESLKSIYNRHYFQEQIAKNWPVVAYKKFSLFNVLKANSTRPSITEEIDLENNEVVMINHQPTLINENRTSKESNIISDIVLGCLDFENKQDEILINRGEREGRIENASEWIADKSIDVQDNLEDSSDKSCVIDLAISQCSKDKCESKATSMERTSEKRTVKRKAEDTDDIIDDRSIKKMKEECIGQLLLDDILDDVIVFSEIKLLF